MPVSAPRKPSGSELSVSAARATSARPTLRPVSLAVNDAGREIDPVGIAFEHVRGDAPALLDDPLGRRRRWRGLRSASSGRNASRRRRCTRAVSWATKSMSSNGTPSHDSTSCAMLVSCPCPLFAVPSTSSTRPDGVDRDLGALARRAAGHLDVVGNADAAMAAPLRATRCAAGGKAAPVGERQRALHAGCVVAVVVGDADAVGVGHRVRRRSGCGGAARPDRSHARARRGRSAARCTNVASGRPALR